MNDKNTENPNYFAIIPADVRYDKRLSPNTKLLYAEITALSSKDKRCFASNSYFAKLFDVSTRSISNWIAQLNELGYIKSEIRYKPKSKNIEVRYLTITGGGIEKNFHRGIEKNFQGGIEKNFQENNTSYEYTTTIISEAPKIDEMIKYFVLNGYHEEVAKKAYRHYETLNWCNAYGKPVKNWKNTVSNNWFKPENTIKAFEEKISKSPVPAKKTSNTEAHFQFAQPFIEID